MSDIKGCQQAAESLYERFEFRYIRSEEGDQAARIEQVCFPPNEACTEKMNGENDERPGGCGSRDVPDGG